MQSSIIPEKYFDGWNVLKIAIVRLDIIANMLLDIIGAIKVCTMIPSV